jgi:LCP family protein required for cell wall assembly
VGRKLLGTLLVTVVLLVLAVGGYLANLNRIVADNMRQQDLLPTVAATAADGSVIPVPTKAPEAKNALNMLLVGTDTRTANDQGRSDVIMVAHVSDDRQHVSLVHVPRDLYVSIPGHGKDKVNAAYSYGGITLLVLTLQRLLDLPFDHVAVIDFEGFRDMTDSIGGVDVTVAEASPGFPVGVMHMNGEQALVFVRERHSLSQGDISRGQRQQAFIKAVLLKGLSEEVLLNPLRFSSFVDATTRNLVVDRSLDAAAIRELAFALRGIRPNAVTFFTAPWTGVGTTPSGASIVKPSEAQFAVLSAALKGDTMQTYKDPVSPRSGFGH